MSKTQDTIRHIAHVVSPLRGAKFVAHEIRTIAHLPFIERFWHPKSRKVRRALAISAAIMLGASSMSVYAHAIGHITMLPHVVIDAFAYMWHGIGAVPVVKYAESIWAIATGE